MEEEAYRMFALNYFNKKMKNRVTKNGHVQDHVSETLKSVDHFKRLGI